MENKKGISLSTILLIIALIVIGVMGVFIYKINNEKSVEIQKSAGLQAQVETLNNTVNDLQGKIDKVSETIGSSNSELDTNNTSTDGNMSFTDEQIKIALSNYLELHGHAGCSSLIDFLGEKGKINYDYSKDTVLDDGKIITSVKFSDYKNAMLEYVSENEFEKNWHKTIHLEEDRNGYLTKLEGGGGLRVYTIKDISKTNDTTYSAKASSAVDNNEYYEENSLTFTIKSYNGKCVIDSVK